MRKLTVLSAAVVVMVAAAFALSLTEGGTEASAAKASQGSVKALKKKVNTLKGRVTALESQVTELAKGPQISYVLAQRDLPDNGQNIAQMKCPVGTVAISAGAEQASPNARVVQSGPTPDLDGERSSSVLYAENPGDDGFFNGITVCMKGVATLPLRAPAK